MAEKTTVQSGAWSATATWGGSLPVDGDSIVVAAGHNLLMDVDTRSWTGLQTVAISGGATPGMIYWKDGTNGYLKIRAGYNLQGTLDTNRGRLLANSDGDWDTVAPLSASYRALIHLADTSTAATNKIDATNLDIRLRAAVPSQTMLHTYGTKYEFNAATAVDPATKVLTLPSAPPSEGTPVTLVPLAGATLPTGYYEDEIFYVRSVSGNTCKLAHQNSDATLADVTAVGSGTIALLTGYAAGSGTVNVLEDISADPNWSTDTGWNYVCLVDSAPENYDQQRGTLLATTSSKATIGTMTGGATTVDSAQFPGARLALGSRNVSVVCAGTSSAKGIIDYGSSTHTGHIHGGAILSITGTATTFYCIGLYNGSGHTNSGSIFGCNYGLRYGSGHTNSGSIFGCYTGFYYGSGHTNSGSIFGCNYGSNSGSGHTNSGSIFGFSSCFYNCSGNTNSGSIFGGNIVFNSGSGNTNSGSIFGFSSCFYNGSVNTNSGSIFGGNIGFNSGSGHTNSGSIFGCNYGFNYGSGHTNSGSIFGCNYGFNYGTAIFLAGSNVSTTSVSGRNDVNEYSRYSFEDANGGGKSAVLDHYGSMYQVACDGVSGAPSADPDSGSGDCIEVSDLQSNLGRYGRLLIVPRHRLWMAAGTYTITYKLQSTFTSLPAGNLRLICRYCSDDDPLTYTEETNSPAITTRSSAADWSQSLAVTITTAQAAWVDCSIALNLYEAGAELYIWPTPTVS